MTWVDDDSRSHELRLLERLLIERRRPVPPPPDERPRLMRDAMRLIATTTEKRTTA